MAPQSRQPNTAHPLLARSARRLARTLNNPASLQPLSWLLWLLAVGGFAVWTLHSYHAPASPAWLGMTIHTTIFAIWGLIAREWGALRWQRRTPQGGARDRTRW